MLSSSAHVVLYDSFSAQLVGVAVAVAVGVLVGVAVEVGVAVGVGDGVAVGVGDVVGVVVNVAGTREEFLLMYGKYTQAVGVTVPSVIST